MPQLDYQTLLAACRPGGSSALTSVTDLKPAGGDHAAVAPARFVLGDNSVYAYGVRYIDGEAQQTVDIDGKSSQGNRFEKPLADAIADGHPLLSRVPHVAVTYRDGTEVYTDLQLPHRLWDGHIRAGTIDGAPATDDPRYRAARDSSPADAKALLETSPTSLVFGSWDSTRKSHQARYRSVLVGEIIGVLADQGKEARTPNPRGGARVDPVAMSVRLTGKELQGIVDAQASELSPKLIERVGKTIKSAGTKAQSASALGLGAIPPSLDPLGSVACKRIIRTHVLSFSALRQLRFGAGPDGDAAARALLAAYALAGLARSDSELSLRANCDLVESGNPTVTLDARYGKTVEFDPITIETADALLEKALAEAEKKADVTWDGLVLTVTGNPAIRAGAVADADE
ncbi:type I-U CRISPR-associated protein Cas7 [Rhodococcus triatomae]|uniref:CRISPR-associated protein Csb1 n=1 Tax=Rhodococcus triatomae TaxID=300028 RepID=A0A1G8IYH9_9NOCA|nr:type I-U CRISPR-associated RAMP protein Csb1/Cas7u [Rhodococcus triatomae]QNG19865.1 type I-U CRISPR-associated protein Cas7 [Rhodococcus triatomae]QNG24219.1 type I-U CRISPR-associated protein Cas7 [Rhodococcus triatomae]SDI24115.1 CRISPR-associated protein Csb1 [Rhodococcus triatomae]